MFLMEPHEIRVDAPCVAVDGNGGDFPLPSSTMRCLTASFKRTVERCFGADGFDLLPFPDEIMRQLSLPLKSKAQDSTLGRWGLPNQLKPTDWQARLDSKQPPSPER